MRTCIGNGKIFVNKDLTLPKGYVLIEDGTITYCGQEKPKCSFDKYIDALGNNICPALIDTHTHGIGGYDFNTCSLENFEEIEKLEYKEGVGSLFCSLVPETHERLIELLKMYDTCKSSLLGGIHLEGPFLNLSKKAVMKEEMLQSPHYDHFKEYINRTTKLKSMTYACELDTNHQLLQQGIEAGIIMNIGHSDATCQQVLEAEKHGAKGVTHLYNAMSQHEHRNPGVVTGAFVSDGLICELIADGFHVHPDVIKATYKVLGKDRIILVSDANPFKSAKEGDYIFSGKNIHVTKDKALVKETGRIAGSTLKMNVACQNMMKYCHCSISDVLNMAAFLPGNYYELNRGSLEKGKIGDIIIINDSFDILSIYKDETFYNYELI